MYRIILADNQSIFRAGAARVLALETDIRIVAPIADAERLLGSIASLPSATVLFSTGLKADLSLVMSTIKAAGSRGILIAEKGEAIPEQVMAELSGIIGRGVTAAELTDCVKKVARGQRCVQPG
jgi:DNA-binding NarL/FixJ family response regulator